MSFPDPIVIAYNSTAVSLPRVSSGPSSGAFKTADQTYGLSVQHAVAKRVRHTARVDLSKVAADPLQPATNRPYSMSSYIVMDVPLFGFTNAEVKLLVDSLTSFLTVSSGANVTKIIGGES